MTPQESAPAHLALGRQSLFAVITSRLLLREEKQGGPEAGTRQHFSKQQNCMPTIRRWTIEPGHNRLHRWLRNKGAMLFGEPPPHGLSIINTLAYNN